MIRLADRPISAGDLLNAFCAGRTDAGAVVSFTGLTRMQTAGAAVSRLTLDAYHRRIEDGLRVETDPTRLRWLLDLKHWPRDRRLDDLIGTV